ncbi:cilia and flagella associated protein 126 [Phyllostomus discolor]|uniref:Protein Flattop n=1 Tax=Phyllostomus discolor TaxID=89673 RepID=A0A833YI29_9CHIR|nr:cilia and flagella associated protein 126 [Phyllostomus discolor]
MANYSANQYEKAFSAKYLQNWSPARPTKESVPAHEGYTQIIANDRGHLLPSVPRSKASPWGSFMGTWQMPLRIPPARVSLTSRSAAGAAALTAWIQKDPDFLKASNGLRPEILGKPGDPDSRKQPPNSEKQASNPAPSPGSPAPPPSPHPSAGHTPGPPGPVSPASPLGSPCASPPAGASPGARCQPGTPGGDPLRKPF